MKAPGPHPCRPRGHSSWWPLFGFDPGRWWAYPLTTSTGVLACGSDCPWTLGSAVWDLRGILYRNAGAAFRSNCLQHVRFCFVGIPAGKYAPASKDVVVNNR
jgi:hypothetical protein